MSQLSVTTIRQPMDIDDPGLFCEIGPEDFSGRAALFLDRDGVVVLDTNYLGRVEDLHMLDGAASAIARCNALNIPVVLVTNQSGIARRYYDWKGFQAVQAALSAELARAGAYFDAVLACAYHKDGHDPLRIDNHPWRKPNPGMIETAAQLMSLDLRYSWIVGDQVHDLTAGSAAGLAGGTLLSADSLDRERAMLLAGAQFAVEVASNLPDAVARLLEQGKLGTRQ